MMGRLWVRSEFPADSAIGFGAFCARRAFGSRNFARCAQDAPNCPYLGRVERPWTPREVSASGQVFEFRLWAALTEQSRGSLHVFLPLADRGIDALVHRLADGKYLPVQAKGRSVLVDGEVEIVVWAESLRDDDALIVSGLITEGGLGPTLLVVREVDFKQLAERSHHDGRPIFAARFGMHPRERSKWYPFLVPTERLVERFGTEPASMIEPEIAELRPMWRSDLGFLGESEAVRLLAEHGTLNLFRSFPDLETAELVVLNLDSRRVVGLQIKTVGVDAAHPAATVAAHASSFQPSPTTHFVVCSWLREEKRFHEECLLIPSEEFRALCHASGQYGTLKFDWHPGSTAHTQLDRFRHKTNDLQTLVLELTNQ